MSNNVLTDYGDQVGPSPLLNPPRATWPLFLLGKRGRPGPPRVFAYTQSLGERQNKISGSVTLYAEAGSRR